MKKIITLFFIIYILFIGKVFSYDRVEDVFLDVDKNYKYISELQSLYDYGMISPDKDGKLSPNKLLSRDEFVGIVMEVSCKKCIKPNTALDYIFKYTGSEVFYDLEEGNQFFYCIAEAKETDVVKGYNLGYKCDDGTQKANASPFCTYNNITLEEALAVLLRNSSVFTIQDNNKVITDINSGIETKDLAKDLKVKNSDGSAYTFYGYFKKALSMSYSEYDLYGKLKKYSLVSIDSSGNINPKKYVTKEEFLQMAYIISKINSCALKNNKLKENTGLALKIKIYDKSCKSGEKCSESTLKDDSGTYDYKSEIKTTCEKGIKDQTWLFYNKNTKEMLVKKGEYIDDFKFPHYGIWQIKLIVRDNCGNEAEVFNEISYLDKMKSKNTDNNLKVSIEANPIFGNGPLNVNFTSIVSGCVDCKYEWNFGDGNKSNLKNPKNVFIYPGIYVVELIVKDENGNSAKANVIIKVNGENVDLSKIDTDADGIYDFEDKCVLVKGVRENFGCPILDNSCDINNPNKGCKSGFVCNSNGYCEAKKENDDLVGSCIYPQNGSSIYGNAVCNSCPCDYKLNFLSFLRKCDTLIPAITSKDKKEIFSKGNAFQIPYNY